jgi:hypothetical protein
MGLLSKTVRVTYGIAGFQQLMPSYFEKKYLSAAYYIKAEFMRRLANGSGNGSSVCGGGKGGTNSEPIALTALKNRKKNTTQFKKSIRKAKTANVGIGMTVNSKTINVDTGSSSGTTIQDVINGWKVVYNSDNLEMQSYVSDEFLLDFMSEDLAQQGIRFDTNGTFESGIFIPTVNFSYDLSQIDIELLGETLSDTIEWQIEDTTYYGWRNENFSYEIDVEKQGINSGLSYYINSQEIYESADDIIRTALSIYNQLNNSTVTTMSYGDMVLNEVGTATLTAYNAKITVKTNAETKTGEVRDYQVISVTESTKLEPDVANPGQFIEVPIKNRNTYDFTLTIDSNGFMAISNLVIIPEIEIDITTPTGITKTLLSKTDTRGTTNFALWESEEFAVVQGLPFFYKPALGEAGANISDLKDWFNNIQYTGWEISSVPLRDELTNDGFEIDSVLYKTTTPNGRQLEMYFGDYNPIDIDDNNHEFINTDRIEYGLCKLYINNTLLYNNFADTLAQRETSFLIEETNDEDEAVVIHSSKEFESLVNYEITRDINGVITQIKDMGNNRVYAQGTFTIIPKDAMYIADTNLLGMISWYEILMPMEIEDPFTNQRMVNNFFFKNGIRIRTEDTTGYEPFPELAYSYGSVVEVTPESPAFLPFGTYKFNETYLFPPLVTKNLDDDGNSVTGIPATGTGNTEEEKNIDREKKIAEWFKGMPTDSMVNFNPTKFVIGGENTQPGKNMNYGRVDLTKMDQEITRIRGVIAAKIAEIKNRPGYNEWTYRNQINELNQKLTWLNDRRNNYSKMSTFTNPSEPSSNFIPNYYVQSYYLDDLIKSANKMIYTMGSEENKNESAQYISQCFFGYAASMLNFTYVGAAYTTKFFETYIMKGRDLDQTTTIYWEQQHDAPFKNANNRRRSQLYITMSGNLKSRTFDTLEDFKTFIQTDSPNSTVWDTIEEQFSLDKKTIFAGVFPTNYAWGAKGGKLVNNPFGNNSYYTPDMLTFNDLRPNRDLSKFPEFYLNVYTEQYWNGEAYAYRTILGTPIDYPATTMMCWGLSPTQPIEHNGASFVETPIVPTNIINNVPTKLVQYTVDTSNMNVINRLKATSFSIQNPYKGLNLEASAPWCLAVPEPQYTAIEKKIVDPNNPCLQWNRYGMCSQPNYLSIKVYTGFNSYFFDEYLSGYRSAGKSSRNPQSAVYTDTGYATVGVPGTSNYTKLKHIVYSPEVYNRALWYLWYDKTTNKYRYMQFTRITTSTYAVDDGRGERCYFDPPTESLIPFSIDIINQLGWREKLMMTCQIFQLYTGVVSYTYKKSRTLGRLLGAIVTIVGIILTFTPFSPLGVILIGVGVGMILDQLGIGGWAKFVIQMVVAVFTIGVGTLVSSAFNMGMFIANAAVAGFMAYNEYRLEKVMNQIEADEMAWNLEMQQKYDNMSETLRAIYNEIGERGLSWGQLIADELRDMHILNSVSIILCPNGYFNQTLESHIQALDAAIEPADLIDMTTPKLGFYGE